MEELVRVKMSKSSREMLREIAARLRMTQQDAADLLVRAHYKGVFSVEDRKQASEGKR